MSKTITIPAGTRLTAVGTHNRITLTESITVEANWRADDDVWVFIRDGVVWEVKLHPGD